MSLLYTRYLLYTRVSPSFPWHSSIFYIKNTHCNTQTNKLLHSENEDFAIVGPPATTGAPRRQKSCPARVKPNHHLRSTVVFCLSLHTPSLDNERRQRLKDRHGARRSSTMPSTYNTSRPFLLYVVFKSRTFGNQAASPPVMRTWTRTRTTAGPTAIAAPMRSSAAGGAMAERPY